MMFPKPLLWTTATLIVTAAACGGDDGASQAASNAGSTNVAQAGAQDFARFRAIVADGDVPDPSTIEAVGFFAEHALDLPPADCGHDVCVHPFLSVMPRFNGGNWTMAYVAMNTPVDPSELERPPLHVSVAVEQMDPYGDYGHALRAGLEELIASLRPEDRLSLTMYGADPWPLLIHAPADDPVVTEALDIVEQQAFSYDDQKNLHAGLTSAWRAFDAVPFEGAERIVLVTSANANVGITDRERILQFGEGVARAGVALGIVGTGDDYDGELGAALGSLGAGSYAFASDGNDLRDVLRLEAETTLFPLATDFVMNLRPAPGYRVGRVYGVERAVPMGDGVQLSLPALFIGQREGADDTAGGRRGGGGGLFVELIADSASGVGREAPAFSLDTSFVEPAGLASLDQTLINPLAPGENPEGMWPVFSDEERGKAFMMLNMYLAFRAAVDFYADGDCSRALGVIDMFEPSVSGWQGKYDDPDIDADHVLLLQLRHNLTQHCESVTPVAPTNFDGGCGFI